MLTPPELDKLQLQLDVQRQLAGLPLPPGVAQTVRGWLKRLPLDITPPPPQLQLEQQLLTLGWDGPQRRLELYFSSRHPLGYCKFQQGSSEGSLLWLEREADRQDSYELLRWVLQEQADDP